MRLNFLENPQQRIASGKRLPTRPLECLIAYGTPEHQVKAVKKVLGAAYSLSQHKETYHVLITLCKHCGSTARVELLFAIRRRLGDMARSRYGNYVLQELIGLLPKQQQREAAKEFVKEVEACSTHPFASRVMVKLLSTPAAAEELIDAFRPHIFALAGHAVGQHVVAAALAHSTDLCEEVGTVVTTAENCSSLLRSAEVPEGIVLAALVMNSATPWTVKDSIAEHLTSGSFLAECVKNDTHGPLLRAAVEFLPPPRQKDLISALLPLVPSLVDSKQLVHVAAAMLRAGQSVDAAIPAQILECVGDVVEAAQHPTRTIVIRAWVEVTATSTTTEPTAAGADAKPKANPKRRSGKAPSSPFEALAAAALALSEVPASSPVIQQLYRAGDGAVRTLIFNALRDKVPQLMLHPSASFVIQAMMDPGASNQSTTANGSVGGGATELTQAVVATVLEPSKLIATAKDSIGSRTAQCAFRFASNDLLRQCAETLIHAPGDENTEPGARSIALDRYASYALAALLQELCVRGPELLDTKRAVMAALKPMVFSLALSPWAGRIVLESVLSNCSKELNDAIRQVIYLKAENWLSEAPATTLGETGATKAGAKNVRSRSAPTGTERGGSSSGTGGQSATAGGETKPRRRLDTDRAYLAAVATRETSGRKRRRSDAEAE